MSSYELGRLIGFVLFWLLFVVITGLLLGAAYYFLTGRRRPYSHALVSWQVIVLTLLLTGCCFLATVLSRVGEQMQRQQP